MTAPRTLSVLLLGAALAGCSTMGTNISGSFTCSAPDGICAPSTVIDDRALAMIAGKQSEFYPAGPYRPETAAPATHLASAKSTRMLSIVFPARMGTDGIFREERKVRVAVANDWQPNDPDVITAAAAMTVANTPLPEAVTASVATVPAKSAPATTPSAPKGYPTADAVAAARAKAASPNIGREAIAAEVERALKKPAAPVVAAPVAPTTASNVTAKPVTVAAVTTSATTSAAAPVTTGAAKGPSSFSGSVED